ncbi:uncharacterized protein LOC106643318 [Copidosoma floridanum]|uniref:uncharacterized protein LOC106643318 n=1 Tax=Copidosoma floridanum TaxID=29053 RepID=UPI0006C951CD|nr:uncharacterized protein LOC106643318 [Copidosoma floridanum]
MGVLLNLLENYQYYNAPEGQDPLGKIVGFGKWGFTSGAMAGLFDAVLISKCQNASQFFNTAGFWVVPMTGMCVTFSSVTYLMNKVRGVDDHINYVAGTWSAGYVFHCWCKDPKLSVGLTLLATVAAFIKKDIEHYGRQKVLELKHDKRWMLEFRNLPGRTWLSPPRFKHNKEDYWTNF